MSEQETIYRGKFTADEILKLALTIMEDRLAFGDLLTSPGMVRDYIRIKSRKKKREEFHVLYMDSQNRLLADECMFLGTIDSCAVHPREVVKLALQHNAAAVILWHNHPSGHAEPSAADRAITKRLKDALALIDVRVLDHMVVGNPEIVSLAERGWI